MELLVPTTCLKIGKSFLEFDKIRQIYGAKAAGLMIIPKAWRPDFIAIPADFSKKWAASGTLDNDILCKVLSWSNSYINKEIIIRSSGINETIMDRGRYLSLKLSYPQCMAKLKSEVSKILNDAKTKNTVEQLGLVVQVYLEPTASGHLSNERHLKPTRHQWVYDTELPAWSPEKGLNSKLAPLPDSTKGLPGKKIPPHQSLRSLGKWATDSILPRCHIEWVCDKDQLWLVQVDFEWLELDRGVDPTTEKVLAKSLASVPKPEILQPVDLSAETEWQKINCLKIFDFSECNPAPEIYLLEVSHIEKASTDTSFKTKLQNEIKILTANSVVVRTDCKQTGTERQNLPRTDTVTAEKCVNWCIKTMNELILSGISQENFIFLLHRFIPARAAAWAYATPEAQTVYVDALWGLPDGLQFSPVDSYEVNVPQTELIQTNSTFKPRYLFKNDNGKWEYKMVSRAKGRARVLDKGDILDIAERTQKISNKKKAQAQIMWFSGLPKELGLGSNLPWYSSEELAPDAPRMNASLKPITTINNINDLNGVKSNNVILKLAPDPSLVRDKGFLQSVIDKATELDIPVILEGSRLGHAFYQLNAADVKLVLPNMPKYSRTRKKKEFGKIVRDKIPNKITSGGEISIEAKIHENDLCHGLAAKLIEEIEELLLSISRENKVAELADIQEVCIGLAKSLQINQDDIKICATRKADKNGAFNDGRVLLQTSLPSSRPSILEKRKVFLMDLADTQIGENSIAIPFTSLINTIGRNSLEVDHPAQGFRAKLKIRNGYLEIYDYQIQKTNVEREEDLLNEELFSSISKKQ